MSVMFESVRQRIPGIGPRPQYSSFAESNGYYERVPIRVGEFTLAVNEEGRVVFETTSQEFCREGPKLKVRILNGDEGWSVREKQGMYHYQLTPSVDLHDEKLARRRAFWHAGQFMDGVQLNHSERFSIMHRAGNDEADLFEDDAFFRDGDAVTIDPFGEFLPE